MKKEKMKPMSKQSMWNISTEAIVNYLQKNNYHVDSATAKCTTYPNNNVQKKIYTHQVEKTNYQQDSNNKP